jgi:hypothetical protein
LKSGGVVLELFPASDIVIHEGLVVAERTVERSGFRDALDLFGDIRTRLAVNDVFVHGEESRVLFAVVRRAILESVFADGLAEVFHEITFWPHVDRVPGREIRIPIGPAVVMLGR